MTTQVASTTLTMRIGDIAAGLERMAEAMSKEQRDIPERYIRGAAGYANDLKVAVIQAEQAIVVATPEEGMAQMAEYCKRTASRNLRNAIPELRDDPDLRVAGTWATLIESGTDAPRRTAAMTVITLGWLAAHKPVVYGRVVSLMLSGRYTLGGGPSDRDAATIAKHNEALPRSTRDNTGRYAD